LVSHDAVTLGCKDEYPVQKRDFHFFGNKISIGVLTGIDPGPSAPFVAAMSNLLFPLPQHRRHPVTPVKGGKNWCRLFALFDIVGLDEGTCGRRLQV
jgi:hypothetical protein